VTGAHGLEHPASLDQLTVSYTARPCHEIGQGTMPLRIAAPTHPQLADSYRRQGLWAQTPLRAGVEQIAERDPDRLAVIDNDGTWTYRELRGQVEAGVGTLLAAGLQPGDAVVIVAPNARESATELADGVVTWSAGEATFRELVAPAAASAASGFRVVASLPVSVTDDEAAARELIHRRLGANDRFPSYQRVLQRERFPASPTCPWSGRPKRCGPA
jgi:hypothetical protein